MLYNDLLLLDWFYKWDYKTSVTQPVEIIFIFRAFTPAPGISNAYSNFTTTNLGDEIVVIYNDGEDNLKRGEDEKIAEAHSTKNLVLAEALINKNKKLEYRKQIGKNASGNYTYFLGNTVPTSSSLIIFPLAKEGVGFNARKTFYSNWCFLDIK